MRRLLLLSLAALCTSACDTSGGDPAFQPLDPALVLGTWTVDEAIREERVTVTEAQEVPLFSEPATSALEVHGADTATFLYPGDYVYEPAGTRRSFHALDVPGGNGEWASTIQVGMSSGGDSLGLAVSVRRSIDGAVHRYLAYLTGDQIQAVTFDRLGVSVDGAVVPHIPGDAPPGEVVVDGRFGFATRHVAAGETLRRRIYWESPFLPYAHSLTFADGGGLVLTNDHTGTQRGTWAIEGHAVRLRLPDQALDATFEVEATAEGLRLTATEPGSVMERAGVYSADARFNLGAGTAADLRTVSTLALAR